MTPAHETLRGASRLVEVATVVNARGNGRASDGGSRGDRSAPLFIRVPRRSPRACARRSPGTSSCASIPSGLGRESSGPGRESSGLGHESSGLGHESSGPGHESRGLGHELRGPGHESSGLGRESRGLGRESRGLGRESRGLGRESRGLGRESRGLGRESSGLGRESTGPEAARHFPCWTSVVVPGPVGLSAKRSK